MKLFLELFVDKRFECTFVCFFMHKTILINLQAQMIRFAFNFVIIIYCPESSMFNFEFHSAFHRLNIGYFEFKPEFFHAHKGTVRDFRVVVFLR